MSWLQILCLFLLFCASIVGVAYGMLFLYRLFGVA